VRACDRDDGIREYNAILSVVITDDSLCAVTRSLVTKKPVTDFLCEKLEEAEKAEAKGKTSEHDRKLEEYRDRLDNGKAVSAADAPLLSRFQRRSERFACGGQAWPAPHALIRCSPTQERRQSSPLLCRPESAEREAGRLVRGHACLLGELGAARREHDESEPGIARIRLAGDEADPLERRELAGDAGRRHSEPAGELDAPQGLCGGRLQLEQDGEVVEAEAMVAAERLVDVPHDERPCAGEVECEVQVRRGGWIRSVC